MMHDYPRPVSMFDDGDGSLALDKRLVDWINARHQLLEVDHLADAHLVKHNLTGATLCERITVHKRTFPAHPSVRRCKKCIKVAVDRAAKDMGLRKEDADA